jgi:hypothetical protein
MPFSRLIVRRVRLASGLVLLVFVAGHLANLALGLVSVDAMERSRGALLMPWQTSFGQALWGHDKNCAYLYDREERIGNLSSGYRTFRGVRL